ncbi:MerR family transcriptional regulator [Paeniglutamicibacter sp. Y32M11]|uniref:MerR family transcriptional regulator n=1 Tax=Paeniglutamicibacter sp. Y32M11 TaxID=2853258 RepID=UPI001C52AEC4|nr:MerR family transcriptional regulator [Paeniglutamicibacter sp. Y32M11]QXQ10010.1 MerR family transcriptional regulator [Paeniglutamicibacter sp. Y32M11]
MSASMSIGDFSRATKLSAKTLRFYHQVGLLIPARVDPVNGYRFYDTEQISIAQVIRNFRLMDMPVEVIRGVLSAPSPHDRDLLIEGHLARMEAQLEATRSAVVSLRGMLYPSLVPVEVTRRSLEPQFVVIIRETINLADLGAWYTGAMDELDALVATAKVSPGGPRGGIWDTELFLNEHGGAALFIPTHSLVPGLPGRAHSERLPAVELAVATHRGTDDTIMQVYGELGRYVTRQGISLAGPIRETYLEGQPGGSQESVTEIGWPISTTSSPPAELI